MEEELHKLNVQRLFTSSLAIGAEFLREAPLDDPFVPKTIQLMRDSLRGLETLMEEESLE